MSIGKLGITYKTYAVLALIFTLLGLSTALVLLTGIVLIVEKDNWCTKQVLQALILYLFSSILSYATNIASIGSVTSLYNITDLFKIDSTLGLAIAVPVIGGLVAIAYLVFIIMALVSAIQGKPASLPLFSMLADKAMGVVKQAPVAPVYAAPAAPVAPVQVPADQWVCQCGKTTSGNFCEVCGKARG